MIFNKHIILVSIAILLSLYSCNTKDKNSDNTELDNYNTLEQDIVKIAEPDTVIIDSNISFEEAMQGTKAPQSVIDQLVIIDVQYISIDNKIHQGQIVTNSKLEGDIKHMFDYMLENNFVIEKVIPIVAYNYGAQNKKRIYQTIKLSAIIAVGIMLVGLTIFQLFPQTLLGLFEASDHMLEIGVPALRTISLSFVFAGFGIVSSCVFQALGNGVYSMFISLTRQIVVILPVAFIFANLFGLNMVWFAYPIAEVISVFMCIFMLRRILKNKVKPLAN